MPKQQKIDLIINVDPAHPNDNRKVLFKMDGVGVEGETITFTNDANNDGIDVEFTIDDKTRRGYVFASDAIAAKKLGGKNHCPTSSQKWSGFMSKSVNGGTLVVYNTNDYFQYFGFALYVTMPGLADPIPYDPIGNNQNGGFPFIDPDNQ